MTDYWRPSERQHRRSAAFKQERWTQFFWAIAGKGRNPQQESYRFWPAGLLVEKQLLESGAHWDATHQSRRYTQSSDKRECRSGRRL